jgi:hypothetical protein
MTNFPPEAIHLGLFDHKDEGNTIRRNVENTANNRTSHPRRHEASFIGIVAGGIFMSWVWQTCTTCRVYKHGYTDVLVATDHLVVVVVEEGDRLSSVEGLRGA